MRTSIDVGSWQAVPAIGFSSLRTLPAKSVPPVQSVPPSAPRSVSAVAGDRRATVKWVRPLSVGTSPLIRYVVVSVPGGRTCVTTRTWCVVPGLVNQRAYRFHVRAQSAVGYSPWSALSAPVVPKPYVKVRVKATSKASKLAVDVDPNKGSGFWTFTVQKRTSAGTWVNVGTYATKGKKEKRTINLPRGTYRVVVAAKYGYQRTVSGSVYLKK